MKKVIFALFVSFLLASCGVGTYSVTSGKSGDAALSFTAADKFPVKVVVDGTEYDALTVKTKVYKKDRRIKETSQSCIWLTSGKHEVSVYLNGEEIFVKTLFLSPSEHRVVEL